LSESGLEAGTVYASLVRQVWVGWGRGRHQLYNSCCHSAVSRMYINMHNSSSLEPRAFSWHILVCHWFSPPSYF